MVFFSTAFSTLRFVIVMVILFDFLFFFLLQIVNNEMFWVVTEICSETNLIKRMKLIKAFIKIASKCVAEPSTFTQEIFS